MRMTGDDSIPARLTNMDAHMQTLEMRIRDELQSIVSRLEQLESDQTHLKVADVPAGVTYASCAAAAASSAAAGTGGGSGVSRQSAQTLVKSAPTTAFVRVFANSGGKGGGTDANQKDGDGFQMVQTKKKRRPKVIRCTGQDGELLGAPEPSRNVHVFRLRKEYGTKDVEKHLQTRSITPRTVEKVSKDDAPRNGFRIEVSVSDMKKIMTEDFWPNGTCVKRFYLPRPATKPAAESKETPTLSSNSDAADADNSHRDTDDAHHGEESRID